MLNMSSSKGNMSSEITGQKELLGSYQLWTLSYVTTINLVYVMIAFILWYQFWVKNLGGNNFQIINDS